MNFARGRASLRRQPSGTSDGGASSGAPPPPPSAAIYAPRGPAGAVAIVGLHATQGQAVLVERAGSSVRVRAGDRGEIGVAERDKPIDLAVQAILGIAHVGDGAFFVVSVLESDEAVRAGLLGEGSAHAVRRVHFTPLDAQAAFVLDSSLSIGGGPPGGASAASAVGVAAAAAVGAGAALGAGCGGSGSGRAGAPEASLAAKLLAQLRSDLEEEHGFYFALGGLDLTTSLQRRQQSGGARTHTAAYCWSAALQGPFAAAGLADAPWLVPAIRGYVGTCESILGAHARASSPAHAPDSWGRARRRGETHRGARRRAPRGARRACRWRRARVHGGAHLAPLDAARGHALLHARDHRRRRRRQLRRV